MSKFENSNGEIRKNASGQLNIQESYEIDQ